MTTTLTWNNKVHFDGSTAFVFDSGSDLNLPVQITTAGTTIGTNTTANSRMGAWLIYDTTGNTLHTLASPSPGTYYDVVIASAVTTASSSTLYVSPQISAGSATFVDLGGFTTNVIALACTSGSPTLEKVLNLVGVSTAYWAVVGSQPTSAWTFSATSS